MGNMLQKKIYLRYKQFAFICNKNSFKFVFLIFSLLVFVSISHAENFSYQTEKVPYSRYLDSTTLTVVPSFDGSYSPNRWEDILSFAKLNNVKFTFFISGVYLIPNELKDSYIYPTDTSKTGISDIGFGGTNTEVVKRIGYINRAIKDGFDIESHLNGHFDGSSWNQQAWDTEFGEFNKLTTFLSEKVHHVRFPLLAFNHKAFPAMAKYAIYSITSVIENGNDFENFNKISFSYKNKLFTFLEFPIATNRENNRNTILMDYNFYIYDKDHNINVDKAQKDMVKIYLEEADKCFQQQRPFFISHHFSNWNNAAYWNAMKEVIIEVKKKYNVKFLTISELYNKLK